MITDTQHDDVITEALAYAARCAWRRVNELQFRDADEVEIKAAGEFAKRMSKAKEIGLAGVFRR